MYKGERFNSISHLIGSVAAVAGLAVLVVLASQQGDPWKIVSFSIYGVSLVFLYSVSALHHSLRGKSKAVFRQLDHHAIYILIAGTYTPFTLVTLRGAWGWSIFGIVWGLAVIGIVMDSLPKSVNSRRVLSLVIYLVMGWLCLIALNPILQQLPSDGFMLLLLGGIFYTVGVVFYAIGGRIQHFHSVWHLFVLAGSVSHFCSILFYVN